MFAGADAGSGAAGGVFGFCDGNCADAATSEAVGALETSSRWSEYAVERNDFKPDSPATRGAQMMTIIPNHVGCAESAPT